MLFAALFVLFGRCSRRLSEAVTGSRLTVAGPFFNKWMTPVGLILLMLTGVVAAPWRGGARRSRTSRRSSLWPGLSGLAAAAVATLYSRFRSGRPGLCFALWRFRDRDDRGRSSGRARRSAAATPAPICSPRWSAWSAEQAPLRRLHVHIGISWICFGFAGNARKLDEQVLLKLGQETRIRQVHDQEQTA